MSIKFDTCKPSDIKDLYTVAVALLEYIDAIPKDIEFDTMPGIDRDFIEETLDKFK